MVLSFSIWAHDEGKKREGSFLEGDKLSAQGSPWRWCPEGTKTLWSAAQERNQRAGAVRTQGEGKLAVGEVCLLGKMAARGKDPGQSSGWGFI